MSKKHVGIIISKKGIEYNVFVDSNTIVGKNIVWVSRHANNLDMICKSIGDVHVNNDAEAISIAKEIVNSDSFHEQIFQTETLPKSWVHVGINN